MVPVNVRAQDAGELGNRITFMFVELPASLADASDRLHRVGHARRASRKESGVPEDADAALKALAHAPRSLQKAAAHALASPRIYNLVVSNIPGPRRADVPARLPPARRLPSRPAVRRATRCRSA